MKTALKKQELEHVSLLAQLAQTNNNLIPEKIGHQLAGDDCSIEGDINDTKQTSENNHGKGILGNNTENSNVQNGNNLQNITQNNENGKNIYAQTVTINEFPKELELLLVQLLTKIAM